LPPPGLLTIDVGNATTALALWQGDVAVRHWQLATEAARTADEHRVILAALLGGAGAGAGSGAGLGAGLGAGAVGATVLGSVVPAAVAPWVAACEALVGAPPLVVGPGVKSGLRVRTEDPREVGPDRLANAVAALALHGAPVLVLDFSTALTLDVVDKAGDYVGAIIAPGLGIAADALAERAAQLGRVPIAPPPSAIGDSTEAGLQAGLFFGYTGLVEGLVARVRAELGPAPVVATGEAPWVPDLVAHCPSVDGYVPLLTLDGLRRIHARQQAG
jgi:type III pantothenate kinase